jgi:hypothetical protein
MNETHKMIANMPRRYFTHASRAKHQQRLMEAIQQMRQADTVRVPNFTDLRSPFARR